MEASRLLEIAGRIQNPKARENWLSFMRSVESEVDDYEDDSESSYVDLVTLKEQHREKVMSTIDNPFPKQQQVVEVVGINARNLIGGMTLLMDAAMEGDLGRVKELLMQGADKTLKDNSGHTACDIASRLGFADIVAILL